MHRADFFLDFAVDRADRRTHRALHRRDSSAEFRVDAADSRVHAVLHRGDFCVHRRFVAVQLPGSDALQLRKRHVSFFVRIRKCPFVQLVVPRLYVCHLLFKRVAQGLQGLAVAVHFRAQLVRHALCFLKRVAELLPDRIGHVMQVFGKLRHLCLHLRLMPDKCLFEIVAIFCLNGAAVVLKIACERGKPLLHVLFPCVQLVVNPAAAPLQIRGEISLKIFEHRAHVVACARLDVIQVFLKKVDLLGNVVAVHLDGTCEFCLLALLRRRECRKVIDDASLRLLQRLPQVFLQRIHVRADLLQPAKPVFQILAVFGELAVHQRQQFRLLGIVHGGQPLRKLLKLFADGGNLLVRLLLEHLQIVLRPFRRLHADPQSRDLIVHVVLHRAELAFDFSVNGRDRRVNLIVHIVDFPLDLGLEEFQMPRGLFLELVVFRRFFCVRLRDRLFVQLVVPRLHVGQLFFERRAQGLQSLAVAVHFRVQLARRSLCLHERVAELLFYRVRLAPQLPGDFRDFCPHLRLQLFGARAHLPNKGIVARLHLLAQTLERRVVQLRRPLCRLVIRPPDVRVQLGEHLLAAVRRRPGGLIDLLRPQLVLVQQLRANHLEVLFIARGKFLVDLRDFLLDGIHRFFLRGN